MKSVEKLVRALGEAIIDGIMNDADDDEITDMAMKNLEKTIQEDSKGPEEDSTEYELRALKRTDSNLVNITIHGNSHAIVRALIGITYRTATKLAKGDVLVAVSIVNMVAQDVTKKILEE